MAISLSLALLWFLIAKTKRSPKERQEKRHLVRQGATTFKEEVVR
jgi:hypothetical protein